MFARRWQKVALVLLAYGGLNLPWGWIPLQAQQEKPKQALKRTGAQRDAKRERSGRAGPPNRSAPAVKAARKEPIRFESDPRGAITFVAFSPDSSILAYGHYLLPTTQNPIAKHEAAIVLCDAATGKELSRLEAPSSSAVFSADGKKLAVAQDAKLSLWDLTSGKELHTCGDRENGPDLAGRTLAFSPDGKLVAAIMEIPIQIAENVFDGREQKICFWDFATGREIRRFGHRPLGTVMSFAFASDSKTVVAEHHLCVNVKDIAPNVSIHTYKFTAQLWDVATGRELGQIGEPMEWCGQCRPFGCPPVGQKLQEVGAAPEGFRIRPVGENRFLVLPHYRPNPVLSVSQDRNTIRLLEAATGKELRRFADFQHGWLRSVALSPDGNTLAAAGHISKGGGPSTVLIWDLSDVNRASERLGPLSDKELEALWGDLVQSAAPRAHCAMCTLAALPVQAVLFLQKKLRPEMGEERMPQLLSDLDSNDFKKREKASQDLQSLREIAKPVLEKALSGHPSLEMRRRIEQLLAKLKSPIPPEQLRSLRAIDLLEHIGTPKAQEVLKTLARGSSGSFVTQLAKRSLERLADKSSSKP